MQIDGYDFETSSQWYNPLEYPKRHVRFLV